MNEAHGMARLLAAHLNEIHARDGGAKYRIIITDKAGNGALIWHGNPDEDERDAWIWDDQKVRVEGS